MKALSPTLALCGPVLLLAACQQQQPTPANDGAETILPEGQEETDLYTNGMTSQRSSGPSGIGTPRSGTTGSTTSAGQNDSEPR